MSLDTSAYAKEDLLAELRLCGADIRNEKQFKCPFHEDKHPSAGVYQSEAGKWLFKCQAGSCGLSLDLWEMRKQRTGQSYAEVFAEAKGGPVPAPTRNPERHYTMEQLRSWSGLDEMYTYTNPATGNIELVVLRYFKRGNPKKQFCQASPNGDGYVLRAGDGLNPLYNRTRVGQADTVVVVEGEKCVHALADIGIVATTSPMGAKNAKYADWSPLRGKTVYLWPDNDADGGGRKYTSDVEALLLNLSPRPKVYLVDIDALGLPDKGDVVDYIASLADDRKDACRLAVLDVLGDSTALSGDGIADWVRAVAAGEYRVLSSGFSDVDYLTRFLMAGKVTVICGSGGSSKSFFLIQLAANLWRGGHRMALYELEDDRLTHLSRLLAQEVGDAKYIDPKWGELNVGMLEAGNEAHSEILNVIRENMWEGPDCPPTYMEILDWIEARIADGYPVIAIDPVTAMQSTDRQWVVDQDFLMRAKAMVREAGSRLILVTHPKSGTKHPGMDSLAGGMSYNRFPHTILWLEFLSELEEVVVDDGGCVEINRKLHLCKTRCGRGQGVTVGLRFKSGSLRFEEMGKIKRKPKGR